jgi:hypothetical protein
VRLSGRAALKRVWLPSVAALKLLAIVRLFSNPSDVLAFSSIPHALFFRTPVLDRAHGGSSELRGARTGNLTRQCLLLIDDNEKHD